MKGAPNGPFPLWGWLALGFMALTSLLVDLLVHRREGAHSRKQSIIWSLVWVGLGLLFNLFVWISFGHRAAQEYMAAYLIEISLSLDNLFVFLVIFRTLKISHRNQHRVLFWGIFGAVVFRGLFILAGVTVLERWVWTSYLFGALLLYAAIHAFREDPAGREENRLVAWLSNHLPVTRQSRTDRFIIREDRPDRDAGEAGRAKPAKEARQGGGRRMATPLLIALIGIELTDILFAIDSVPAAFSVSRAPFIIYSSNLCAILGLRSFYLVMAQSLSRFRYLHYGLAGVLGFTSLKLMTDHWVHLPPLISVGIIVLMIGAAALASLRANPDPERLQERRA